MSDTPVKRVARACPRRRGYTLKERDRDDQDDEIARPKSKVGEITMDNELLYAKIEVLEGKRPLAHRRSRR
jgi:transposase